MIMNLSYPHPVDVVMRHCEAVPPQAYLTVDLD